MFVIAIFALLLAKCCLCSVNLLLPMHETDKLLGLQRELFYVRDGVVNEGAVQFKIPVASTIDSLIFLWWNADFTSNVNYKVLVKVLSTDIMLQPSLNISQSGQVPKMPTYWKMSLPCSKLSTGQSGVEIHFEIGAHLKFKLVRDKYCDQSLLNDQISPYPGASANMSSHAAFVYSLLVAFLVAFALTIFVTVMQRKTAQEIEERPSSRLVPLLKQTEDPSPLLPPIDPGSFPMTSANPGFSIYDGGMTSDAESRVTDWIQQQYMKSELLNSTIDENEAKTPEEVAKDLEVERSRLKLGSLLQEGTFGKVYQGRFSSDMDASEEVDVMIKTVMSWSSSTQSKLLVLEGVKLAHLNHRHLLYPWAMTWDGSSPMFVYPYSSHGNMKLFLSKYSNAGLSTHQIVKYGAQLLSALSHIHKRSLIHKDIASRNCFLGENQNLKLCDSALSKDLFPGDYHCLGDNNNRPIKWMPLESITQNKFTKASDVWSFGVFMWELMTKAQQPFSEVDPFEIEDYLTGGYRLHQPLNCPDQLYSVLVSCWGSQPQERASVQQLHQTLQELQKQLQQFV